VHKTYKNKQYSILKCSFAFHTPLSLPDDIPYVLESHFAPFLQFQRVKKSDADEMHGRELDFGKMIEPLYVPQEQ